MSGARDRYDRSAREEVRQEMERDRLRFHLQRWAVLVAFVEAAHDPHADTPGTWSNTLLTAWLAEDPRNDGWHEHKHVPQYATLRKQAWRALSGEYKRGLLDVIAAEQDDDDAGDDLSDVTDPDRWA